jgi:hypothetical protein
MNEIYTFNRIYDVGRNIKKIASLENQFVHGIVLIKYEKKKKTYKEKILTLRTCIWIQSTKKKRMCCSKREFNM